MILDLPQMLILAYFTGLVLESGGKEKDALNPNLEGGGSRI